MTILYINTGSSPNKGDGDTLRTAFNKINENFKFVGPIADAVLAGSVLSVQAGTGISVSSSTGLVIVSATTATTATLGSVIIGQNINIIDGVISIDTPFSGSYADLTGTPTNVSTFINDAGYLTTSTLPSPPDSTRLVNGASTFVLNSDGSVTFSDSSIQTTAYLGTLTTVSTFVNDVNYLTSSTLNQYVNATIIQSNVAPSSANTSTLWYDTVSGRSYVYYVGTGTGVWVDAAPQIGYVLPVASTSTLGGVKIGANFVVAPDGTISVNPPPGPIGATGTTATITVGTVQRGLTATVVNVGDQWNAIFDFTLPQGDTGTQGVAGPTGPIGPGFVWQGPWNPTSSYIGGQDVVSYLGSNYIKLGDGNSGSAPPDDTMRWQLYTSKGDTGTAATIAVGTVTASTDTTSVTNVGDQYNAIFDFTLPRGPAGFKGDTGTAATVNIGTVVASTTTVAVTNTGTTTDAWLNFTLLQGPQGPIGPIGNTGTQGIKGDTGTSIARSINYVIDGGGLAISTGTKGYVVLDFNGTLTSWTILGDTIGSIVVDVKRASYANFPSTTSITGTGKPTLNNGLKNQNTSMSGWTSSTIYAGDILEFYVNSASTTTRVTVDLKIMPTL